MTSLSIKIVRLANGQVTVDVRHPEVEVTRLTADDVEIFRACRHCGAEIHSESEQREQKGLCFTCAKEVYS